MAQKAFSVEDWAKHHGWTVQYSTDGKGYADQDRKLLVIPPADNAAHAAVRMHNVLHALSGEQHPDGEFGEVLEEVRVDALANNQGVDVSHRMDHLDFSQRPRPKKSRDVSLSWLQTVTSATIPESWPSGDPVMRPDAPPDLAAFFRDCDKRLAPADRTRLVKALQALAVSPSPKVRDVNASDLDAAISLHRARGASKVLDPLHSHASVDQKHSDDNSGADNAKESPATKPVQPKNDLSPNRNQPDTNAKEEDQKPDNTWQKVKRWIKKIFGVEDPNRVTKDRSDSENAGLNKPQNDAKTGLDQGVDQELENEIRDMLEQQQANAEGKSPEELQQELDQMKEQLGQQTGKTSAEIEQMVQDAIEQMAEEQAEAEQQAAQEMPDAQQQAAQEDAQAQQQAAQEQADAEKQMAQESETAQERAAREAEEAEQEMLREDENSPETAYEEDAYEEDESADRVVPMSCDHFGTGTEGAISEHELPNVLESMPLPPSGEWGRKESRESRELDQTLDDLDQIIDRATPGIGNSGASVHVGSYEQMRELLRAEFSKSDPSVLEIHEHIDRNHVSHAIRRPSGATDTGTVPVLWERYSTDKMVFQRRRPGGALLIDCSGSMAWDWNVLKKSIAEYPALTIGVYSGMGNTGRLCVLARNGRWADFDESEMAGGNDVDIEALEWLADQKGPRLWLSDGEACGGQVGNMGLKDASTKIRSISQRAKISRTEELDNAMDFFRTRGERRLDGVFRPADREFMGYSFNRALDRGDSGIW